MSLDDETANTLADIANHLKRTRPWVTFLSVVGFIMAALHILVPVFLLLGPSSSEVSENDRSKIVLFFPAVGLLYAIPFLYLRRYATNIRAFCKDQEIANLIPALNAQRVFWKITGVYVAVPILVFTLVLLVMLLTIGFGFVKHMLTK